METSMRKYLYTFTAIGSLLISPLGARAAVDNINCTNHVSDGALINRVIAKSNPGDEIRFHGACLTAETIVLLGDRSYLGDARPALLNYQSYMERYGRNQPLGSEGTIIRQADSANLPALVASDSWAYNWTGTGSAVHIADLALDGNSAHNKGTNVLVLRSWLSTVEDVEVQNAPGDAIQITSISRNGTGYSTGTNQVNSRFSNLFINGAGGDGFHVVDPFPSNTVTDSDLLDSWIAGSAKSAIQLDNAAGWKIRGNHVYGVGNNAIYANRCFATTIQDNYIEEFGSSPGLGTWYGIACTLQGDSASVISGNKIFMMDKPTGKHKLVYIGIPKVNYGLGQVIVIGNAIYGKGASNETGLSYEPGPGSSLSVISAANSVQSVGVPMKVGPGVKVTSGQ